MRCKSSQVRTITELLSIKRLLSVFLRSSKRLSLPWRVSGNIQSQFNPLNTLLYLVLEIGHCFLKMCKVAKYFYQWRGNRFDCWIGLSKLHDRFWLIKLIGLDLPVEGQ